MQIRLAVTALGIALLFACGPDEASTQQKQQADKVPAPTVTIVDNSTRPAKKDGPAQKPPETHTGIEWSNWALVIIGGIGVLAAFFTLKKIERQTKATEAAARASQKQIDHLLTSERAWLTITAVNRRDCVIHRGAIPPFRWRVKNVGKTPAKIVETQAICQLTDSYKLPPEPVFPADTIKVQDRILAPGDFVDYFTYWSDENGVVLRTRMEDINLIWLTAFGYVKYKTVLDDEIHETRFCDGFIDSASPTERDGEAIRIKFRPNLIVPASYTKST